MNPNAVEAMKEAGIDISNQKSEVIDPEILNDAELVVIHCGHEADHCPVTPPHVGCIGDSMTQLRKGEKKKNVLISKEYVTKSVRL